MQKIIEPCERQGIALLLLELPGANDKRNELPFEHKAILRNNKEIKIYNLNNYEVSSKIIDPSKDWLAADHLNQDGARKITAFLFNQCIEPTEP